MKWHLKHCADTHMVLVHSIREAYPFNPEDKKHVHKFERENNDFDARKDWGTVTITDAGPKKLMCDNCGCFLVDKTKEAPFWYCSNCFRNGRKFELCCKCNEALKVKPSHILHKQSDTSEEHDDSHEQPSSSLGREDLSGNWHGYVKEAGSKRKCEYALVFFSTGAVEGSGPTGCTISGSLRKNSLQWTEKHDWGTANVSGNAKPGPDGHMQIVGSFEASDGTGKDEIHLTREKKH